MTVAASPDTLSMLDDAARRERAKMRFYVLCQALGWGGFFLMQIVIYAVFPRGADPRTPAEIFSSLVLVMTSGVLLTHYTRPLFARWGWKHLGWRALGWRVVVMAIALSVVWNVFGFAYATALYAFCDVPWPSRLTPGTLFFLSVVQSSFLTGGWLCIYFFYHLFDRYNRLQIEQLRLAAHVKEAELRALKSQVNPHFIFNSLNSLRALIDEDPARARQAVTQLANLLRYSLQSAQSETVAFEDELRVVNDYLALEQVRHEERLRVRLDIDPATLGLAVPPLLLQTLVENAVKYGISTRPEGGEIVIMARCEEGQLRLRVINPGELPASGAQPAAAGRASSSTGLGLKNAADRLRMFFGDRAKLQLRSESDSRVVAEVLIPAQLIRA